MEFDTCEVCKGSLKDWWVCSHCGIICHKSCGEVQEDEGDFLCGKCL